MPDASPAAPEVSLPLETLLRLAQGGPASLRSLPTLIGRGDWRTRTLALSAAGRIVREDPSAWHRDPLRHTIARRVPWLRRRLASSGPRGAYIRDSLANALGDRSWIVRTAAALALGECHEPSLVERLRARLADSHRPPRIAAAAALLASGGTLAQEATDILAGAEQTPERIGDTALSLEWLARLAAGHGEVLMAWLRVPGAEQPAGPGPEAWAELLAGPTRPERVDSREAEILRYAQEKDTHYNVTKPFTRVNRDQNVRLLHAFLAVAEQLRIPYEGLVLDLGGGAAWVSELLAKLGYRPVTLDVADSLLRIGRDRFKRENLRFRPVAADMTALPVASESVDAVVVIDALHHVPNVPAVFREAYRVLVSGGQFLLAEPGEGHAEAEKSLGEMRDHQVCEREIHLFEAVRYGREAGFDDARIVPHYEPLVSMTPEDFRAAMTTPSERWRVGRNGLPVAFDEFLVQSILSHPVLAFAKGERPLDSRLPRELRARLEPALIRNGRRVHGRVRVANEGDTLWLRGGDQPGRVRLGLQLMTAERKLLSMDFARAELAASLPPSESLEVDVDVSLPDEMTPYILKLDMVDEQVCWFEDVGSRPVYVSL